MRLARTISLLILLLVSLVACKPKYDVHVERGEAPVGSIIPATAPLTGAKREFPNVGFASRYLFDQHYEKHGGEFPGSTRQDYLRRAQELRDAPKSANILEMVRPSDQVVVRFDKESGAFIAFNPNHTIRTFFKPNSGVNYFYRQTNRQAGR